MDTTLKSDSATDDTASEMEESPQPAVTNTIDTPVQAPGNEKSASDGSELESPLSTPGVLSNKDGDGSPSASPSPSFTQPDVPAKRGRPRKQKRDGSISRSSTRSIGRRRQRSDDQVDKIKNIKPPLQETRISPKVRLIYPPRPLLNQKTTPLSMPVWKRSWKGTSE